MVGKELGGKARRKLRSLWRQQPAPQLEPSPPSDRILNHYTWHRRYFKVTTFKSAYGGDSRTVQSVGDWDQANLIGSSCEENPTVHMPALDIDFEADLIPSSTPGHYHLYLDRPLTWDQYKKLLDVLLEIGYIQQGWYDMALRDQQTLVRRPGVYKPYEDLKKKIEQNGLFADSLPDLDA